MFKVGGIVRLNGTDLEDWLGRQRERTIRLPTPPAAPVDDGVALRLIA